MLEYPELHELAASKNPVVRALHDFSVKLNPEPHRRVFLKPFMQTQTPEFCSSCHKVHLDVPVNNYRWFRGFNEYDNWQASGVSGLGARSFYYPPKPQGCPDCHMPATKSADMGNVDGKVHSHAFPGREHRAAGRQRGSAPDGAGAKFPEERCGLGRYLRAVACSRDEPSLRGQQNELQTTFAVGEEAEMKTTGARPERPRPVTAPLDKVNAAVRRGDSVRRRCGGAHAQGRTLLPRRYGGRLRTWVELKAVDDKGQTIFWSGKVDDDGKGPVEPGAHFYRSLQVDEHGNPINKRNAWATRAVVYVRLIPPGAADTIHYRMNIPPNAGNKITVTARVCYRKFSWWNTHFAYAGRAKRGSIRATDEAQAYDDRKFALTATPRTFRAR